MKKLFRNEKGQAMVEFALVLPLLLLLVCGIIDFGWLFYNQLSLQNACREGARYVCVHSSEEDLQDKVYNKVKENVPGNLQSTEAGLTVVYTFSNGAEPTNGEVEVKATAKLQFLTPIFGMFQYRDEDYKMEAGLVMKVES